MSHRDRLPPFRFQMADVVQRLRGLPVAVDGISINLPFITVSVKADDRERVVAREVVIRLADRRVLNAFECCDDCINHALKSLQEIRQIVVDKQVELSDRTDGLLYILLDSIRESIRQFLTFEQRLQKDSPWRPENRELYFGALEMLRAHIHRTLLQIAKVAHVKIPGIAAHMRYDEQWQLSAYEKPTSAP